MVIINRVVQGYEHRCVSLDNEKGTFIATETLIKLGHKKNRLYWFKPLYYG